MDKKSGMNLGLVLLAVLLILLARDWWQASRTTETVPYSAFEQQMRDGKFADVTIDDKFVTGRLKTPESDGRTTVVSTWAEPELANYMSRFGVPYQRVHESAWLSNLISWLFPVLLLVGLWSYMARRASNALGGGGLL
ncbi:MAG: cell division protein FtsH, partial [Proteobacteria bacterium]|nr:cell division protein FtsH [Pseudomonadota bacterium]